MALQVNHFGLRKIAAFPEYIYIALSDHRPRELRAGFDGGITHSHRLAA